MLVQSGGNDIWSSDDCTPAGTDQVQSIQPGDVYQLNANWNQQQSKPGCPTGQPNASPGSYEVIGKNDQVKSNPATFTISLTTRAPVPAGIGATSTDLAEVRLHHSRQAVPNAASARVPDAIDRLQLIAGRRQQTLSVPEVVHQPFDREVRSRGTRVSSRYPRGSDRVSSPSDPPPRPKAFAISSKVEQVRWRQAVERIEHRVDIDVVGCDRNVVADDQSATFLHAGHELFVLQRQEPTVGSVVRNLGGDSAHHFKTLRNCGDISDRHHVFDLERRQDGGRLRRA